MIEQLANKLKNLIKRGATTAAMRDSGNFPLVQVKYFNRTAVVEVLSPYGFCSSPPVGSLATVFNVLGQEENRTAVIDSPATRFKGLKPGEVAVGNYQTKARIYFKADGSVLLDVPNGEVTIDTSRVTMTGDLRVAGDIIDNYGSNANNISDMRDIYNIHVHPENDAGGPTDDPNEKM